MSDLRIGRVAAVHPEDHSVDLVMVDDGSRLAGVQVLMDGASTDTGTFDIPAPDIPPSGNPWDLTQATSRDRKAIVGRIGRRFVVLGFLAPQISQMTFPDGRRIQRHASDVYESTDLQGNHEFYHPSGTYVRIGTSSAHEDLTGKDADGLFKITKNTSAAVHYHIHIANAGAVKADLDIDPSGNLTGTLGGSVSLTVAGYVSANITGNVDAIVGGMVTMTAGGPVSVTTPGTITLACPLVRCAADLEVDGVIVVNNLNAGTAAATIAGSVTLSNGSLTVPNGEVTARGTHTLTQHQHPGGSPTGLPNG